MQPPTRPSVAPGDPEERRSSARPSRHPFLTAAHFLQGLFLCLLALAAAIVEINGGSDLDAFLATDIGLFFGWLLYPRRLFILTALVLPLGVVNQLFDYDLIGGEYLEAAYLLALALGLLAITWATRIVPAWVRPGSVLPGLVVVVLGLLLLAVSASESAAKIILSFWLPTAVLGALGLWYLLMSVFGRVKP